MADPITPTDQTSPLDAGHTTSEHTLARLTTITASVIAVLSTVTDLLGKAQAVIPEAPKGLGLWIGLGAAAVAFLSSVAYGFQRALIKIEAIKAGNAAPATPDANASDAAANVGK